MKTARGAVLDKHNKLTFGELPLPELRTDDVLVEVFGGPINPSDVYFTEGTYPVKRDRPTICGFEGSGVVVGTGGNKRHDWLVGRKVCFFGGDERSFGSWGDYTVMPASTVFPLPDNVDLEQGASCLVNPLTVEIFIYECKQNNHKAVVHTGAAGSLGKILVAACKKHSIALINVVRTEAQVRQLEQLGSQHTLNSSSSGFAKDFEALARSLKASAFFDAVCGPTGSLICELMPPKSTVYAYGVLSRMNYNFNPSILIFKSVKLQGIWLSKYGSKPEVFGELVSSAFENIGEGTYKTVYAREFTPDQIHEALKFYEANASAGKVMIKNWKHLKQRL